MEDHPERFDDQLNREQEPLLMKDPKMDIHVCYDCCCPSFIPKRYIFSVVGFLASTIAISLNINLSMAIVCMVDRSNASATHVKSSNECLSRNMTSFKQVEGKLGHVEEFQWSPELVGLALGALYYGQMVGFLPGGRLAEVYGGKRTLIASLLTASVFTSLLPLCARLSIYAFIACRFLVGVGTAPVIPVLFYLISRWVPSAERSFNASFMLAGYSVGSFVSFLTTGLLCSTTFLGGWPSVFYIGGLCGFSWCLLCYLFVYETPRDHPTITSKELDFISKNLGPTKQTHIKIIPWKSMLLSVPFWALAVGYFGQFWVLGFYSTTLALYMGTILDLDSITDGELSSLPPLTRGLFACVCGYLANRALKRGLVGESFIRKGATVINSVFSCAGFIAILLAGCDPTLNTVFFTVGGLLGDFITFGVCMAGVDIAPNLSGTVSGILNLIGVIPFFFIPALVGWITKHELRHLLIQNVIFVFEKLTTKDLALENPFKQFEFSVRSMAQWRYVYYCTIGVVSITTFIYVLFGTSEPQSWGIDDEEISDEEQEINDAIEETKIFPSYGS